MMVADFFSGLGGWSEAFKNREHTVVTIDFEEKFNPTICKDIMELEIRDLKEYLPIDVVLASPPCNCFSLMTVSRYWNKNGTPKEEAKKAIKLLHKTLSLIAELQPKFWVIENPMGMMRTLSCMKLLHHRLVTQCQYGKNVMKPTDLWGKFPLSFSARKCVNGSDCHESAPRGTLRGTQALSSPEERAKIPYGLSQEFCIACENPTELKSTLFASLR